MSRRIRVRIGGGTLKVRAASKPVRKGVATLDTVLELQARIEQLQNQLTAVIAHNDAAVELAHARGVQVAQLKTELQRVYALVDHWFAESRCLELRVTQKNAEIQLLLARIEELETQLTEYREREE